MITRKCKEIELIICGSKAGKGLDPYPLIKEGAVVSLIIEGKVRTNVRWV